MIALTLANLTQNQRGVRAYFQEGGSLLVVAYVVLVIVGVVVVTYLLARRQQLAHEHHVVNSPGQLFEHVLGALELAPGQQRWLSAMAKDLGLEHPAAMLLSRKLFTHHVTSWQRLTKRSTASPSPEAIGATHARLFP